MNYVVKSIEIYVLVKSHIQVPTITHKVLTLITIIICLKYNVEYIG